VNRSRAEAIVVRLLTNAADLKYGSVSVTAKVHNGRVVEVLYATTECTRDELLEKADAVLNGKR
jgi:hypothetical protein